MTSDADCSRFYTWFRALRHRLTFGTASALVLVVTTKGTTMTDSELIIRHDAKLYLRGLTWEETIHVANGEPIDANPPELCEALNESDRPALVAAVRAEAQRVVREVARGTR